MADPVSHDFYALYKWTTTTPKPTIFLNIARLLATGPGRGSRGNFA